MQILNYDDVKATDKIVYSDERETVPLTVMLRDFWTGFIHCFHEESGIETTLFKSDFEKGFITIKTQ